MQYDYDTPEYKSWMEKADLAKDKVLEQAMMRIEDLYAIINRRIGIDLAWSQHIKDSRGRKYIECESSEIPLDSIGVCKYLFRELRLGTFNSSVYIPQVRNKETYYDEYEMEKEPVAKYWMTIHFEYEHTGGGSNGHELCTCWFEDGQWKVQFVDTEEVITSSVKLVKCAMPGREKYIQAIMDEYGCSHEEAEEIIAEEINSGCHGKSKKKAKKSVKSSLRKENMELYLQYRDDIFHAINEVDKKYNMSGVGPFSTKEDFDEVIEWMDIHDYWNDEDFIDSGCHGKAKKPEKKEKKDEIAQTRRARNTESLNNLYGKMF